MKKRILSLVLVIAMLMTLCVGCGGAGAKKAQSEIDKIDFNETGYPLVNEPITLKVGVLADTTYQAAWEDLAWVQELEAKSGISLEFVVMNDTAVDLMFATQDFPDISWNIGNSQQIYEAAKGGFVYALDEYMEEYAPNWDKYFKENELSLTKVTSSDGHIYSFPMVREEEYHYQIRDLWQINKTWLDELGIAVPTTIDEFYNALVAIRDNAGKGSIPADVVPYYTTAITANIGGALDILNSYGVRVSSENYFVTVDDNGKVEFNFANAAIKEPMKFMHKLVEEDLLPKSCFTDPFATYLGKVMSDTKKIGCFHAYYNYSTEKDEYVDFGPLDAGNGATPMMRSQANSLELNYFTVYSTCKYPELAVRLANMIAEPEWSLQTAYGMLSDEDSSLYKDDQGNYRTREGLNGYDLNIEVPSFRVSCLISDEVFDMLSFDESAQRYQRQKSTEEVYAGKTMPQKNLYPIFNFSEENLSEINELYYDISQHVMKALNDWAVYGNIDKEWDGYVEQLNKLGLERYLSLLQEELDAFYKK